jgi:hypothetical protein
VSIIEQDEPLPLFREGTDWREAHAVLAELGFADGLPQIPPTKRLLAEMVAAVAEPERSFGMMPPMFGDLTPAAIAYCCVLAGCVPEELPIVLTAAEACLADDFNLLGLLTTTGTPAVAVVVHGPIAGALSMNAGTNCLGPGNRANACIGRALALVTRVIGGAVENVGDMATMGQPGKYGFCFAESAARLLPSLAARRGLPAEANAVTVLGVSGTMEVLPLDARDTGEAILTPMAAAMMTASAVASSGRPRPPAQHVLLLPRELMETLAKRGWGLSDIQGFLAESPAVDIPGLVQISTRQPLAASPADIIPIETGGAGVKMTYQPLWAGGSRIQTLPVRAVR